MKKIKTFFEKFCELIYNFNGRKAFAYAQIKHSREKFILLLGVAIIFTMPAVAGNAQNKAKYKTSTAVKKEIQYVPVVQPIYIQVYPNDYQAQQYQQYQQPQNQQYSTTKQYSNQYPQYNQYQQQYQSAYNPSYQSGYPQYQSNNNAEDTINNTIRLINTISSVVGPIAGRY